MTNRFRLIIRCNTGVAAAQIDTIAILFLDNSFETTLFTENQL